MSIIFGIRKPTGGVVRRPELLSLAQETERYAPDGLVISLAGRIGLGFQACHTHLRSELDLQPLADTGGNMLTLDGRLDNHVELRHILGISDESAPDSFIVLQAFHRWGEGCFSQLVGDWAIALWSSHDRVLYLARDHAGTRTLYFEQTVDHILWSTHLETFTAGKKPIVLNEAYVACYLTSQPIRDMTPYQGICAVSPAHYFAFHEDKLVRKEHWQWMVREKISFKTDEEFEEHFFALFRQSVERRSGQGKPVLAQLSGGMDSSSIVCMSDYIRKQEPGRANELLDTVSFYDDTEPTWNERPYFSAVETRRSKTGIHIDTSFASRVYAPLDPQIGRYRYPGGDDSSWNRELQFHENLGDRDYRSILSGVGGDEILGGVPTCYPELADHLYHFGFLSFLKQTVFWSVSNRVPPAYVAMETLRNMAHLYRQKPPPSSETLPPWLTPQLRRIVLESGRVPDPLIASSFGLAPTSVTNGQAWWSIMEGLPHRTPGLLKRYEYRYPYLDRDLVDFVFRIPREQLLRPGQRRSLMRRALGHILPAEVLGRRRKAYVRRGPRVSLEKNFARISWLLSDSCAARHGYIETPPLQQALVSVVAGNDLHKWPQVLRAILFEIWLRSIASDVGGSMASLLSN